MCSSIAKIIHRNIPNKTKRRIHSMVCQFRYLIMATYSKETIIMDIFVELGCSCMPTAILILVILKKEPNTAMELIIGLLIIKFMRVNG